MDRQLENLLFSLWGKEQPSCSACLHQQLLFSDRMADRAWTLVFVRFEGFAVHAPREPLCKLPAPQDQILVHSALPFDGAFSDNDLLYRFKDSLLRHDSIRKSAYPKV